MTEEEYRRLLQERQEFLRGEQELEQEQELWTVRSKKYFISQQEIVFYTKDAEGVVRIIHRPLCRREEVEEGSYRRSRRNSQPDMRGAVVRQEEGSSHLEIRQVQQEQGKGCK